MLVDALRASRSKSAAVFVEFTRLYKKYPSALYCFFEGEDDKYYGIRIQTIVKPEKDVYFSCDGKKGVLGIYRMLKLRKYYANVKAAYFVDRDFDESIIGMNLEGVILDEIYETPCYSIENFYTSTQCISKILRSEFKISESDEDFEKCVSLYTKLQIEFHNSVEFLNAWLACQRARSTRLNISSRRVSDFVSIGLDSITAKYTVDELCNVFGNTPAISQEELDNRRSDLKVKSFQKSFRGKFEIDFLRIFLTKLIAEANQNYSLYFTARRRVTLNLPVGSTISDLSQYADTPACLYSYLEAFRVSS